MSSDVSSPPNSSSSPNSSSVPNSSSSHDNDSAIIAQAIPLPHTPPKSKQRAPVPKPVTPYSTGSAARVAVDDGKLNATPYVREDYDEYIKDDLENSRVLLHVEKFLELIFDIPLSETTHRKHIDRILKDDVFSGHMTEFLDKCAAGLEKPLYGPIAALYNRGLELLDELDPLPKDAGALKLNFSVNDPNHLCDGVFHCGLSPDLKSLLASLGEVAVGDDGINWTNVIKPIEVKAQDAPALCGGEHDPRPLHNGKDPLTQNHARTVPPEKRDTAKVASAARKRERSGSMAGETEFSVPKVARQSQGQFSANRKARPAPEAEVSPQVQCGRYAMEQLSNILLRSHAILTLFDKDRFQIHYYDRSAIALSSIVNLSTPEGQELFIIMLMGLRRLTSEGLGLRKVLGESEKFYTELGYFKSQISEGSSKDWRRMFHGMKLCVGDKTYTLQEILFRQPGIVGRTTCVVAATDGQGTEVVVKISCPVERRQSEVDLIVRAREYASRDDRHQWVLKHLPEVIASLDIRPEPRSAQRRLCEFLNSKDTKWAAGKKPLFYESRILRITVFEKLYPLLYSPHVSTHAQVFFDVLQTHKWLYDHPRILHRDISMSNIMYRIDENGEYFGVPNDLDLASLRTDLDSRTATSTHRTGTPPFMALDLQNPNATDVPHLYRHDLESLFYVIVMLVVRHKIGKPPRRDDKRYSIVQLDANPGLNGWFDAKKSWGDLRTAKNTFITGDTPQVVKGMIKPDFKSFEEWVMQLRKLFRKGLNARAEDLDSNPYRSAEPVDPSWLGGGVGYASGPTCQPKAPYSDETLGDFVTYASFFLIMRRFGKTLLKVRYTHGVQP